MAHGMGELVAMCGSILTNTTGNSPITSGFTPNISLIVNSSKVTDHHAILPTIQAKSININSLSADERNVLLMICNKLICAVSEKHTCAVSEKHTYSETLV